jgi:hypothetical protein
MGKVLRAVLWIAIVGGLSAAMYFIDVRIGSQTATAYDTPLKPESERAAVVVVDPESQRMVGVNRAPTARCS